MPAPDVLETLRGHRDEIRSLGAVRPGLFGSVARAEATPTSDVDLLVELDRRTFDRYMDLKLETAWSTSRTSWRRSAAFESMRTAWSGAASARTSPPLAATRAAGPSAGREPAIAAAIVPFTNVASIAR
jgi:hypothetical protein